MKSGEGYKNLKPVIIIAILDYEFIELPEYVMFSGHGKGGLVRNGK